MISENIVDEVDKLNKLNKVNEVDNSNNDMKLKLSQKMRLFTFIVNNF